ncbi:MAG TPA: aldo/keto reductase [Actinomycetota bacterium]|nr:aldo/keto reductase [Actinomycetota bacterium]
MRTRRLGKNGPEITVVGYGAWEAGGDMWGPNESEEQVINAIRAAIDAGMTWIDTAEVYGRGTSERLVGRAVKGRRDDVLIFTKVAPRGSGTGFRPDEVKQAIRGSLERLELEYVDLYQLHWPSQGVEIEDTWGAMAETQDAGLARHIGVSNFDWSLLERCLAVRHVDSVQNQFSLLNQADRRDLLPKLQEAGVGYLAYSPLGLGILTGALKPDHEFHPQDFRGGPGTNRPQQFREGNMERILGQVDRLRPIAERLSTTVATVALAWVVAQPGLSGAIAGSRNPDHVIANAAAGDLELDADTLAEIEEIFPDR